MTVIAVKKESNNEIIMSCDEQTTYGDNKYTKDKSGTDVNNVGKVWKVNDMLVGAAGKVSESNLLKIFTLNHKPKSADVESVIEFLLEFRDFVAKKTGKPSYELYNHIFIVTGGKIFQCLEMDVNERDKFWALGSGMFLALSALHLGEDTEKAVDVAKTYDLFCGGKTHTLSITNTK